MATWLRVSENIRLQPGWLGKLDGLLHLLHVPHFLMRPICEAYEKRVCGGSPWVLTSNQTTGTTATIVEVNWTSNADWNRRH